MIPRKPLDIGLKDTFYAALQCARPVDRPIATQQILKAWGESRPSLVSLSVRSAFDALLATLNFPPGSEVLVSAMTIRDMPRIVKEHGLVPIPLDIDSRTLAPSLDALKRTVTARAKAILVAHLFGSRVEMLPLIQFAQDHGLLVIEDCAQAYAHDGYRGHELTDVSLFSFGPIKTASALQGAVVSFRDPELRDIVKQHQEQWPVQSRWRFSKRIAKYSMLVTFCHRSIFNLFVWVCRAARQSHDGIISARVRGFPGERFFEQIREQPSAPLLQLLKRRLLDYNVEEITARVAAAHFMNNLLSSIERPGVDAEHHTYWLYPILHDRPEQLLTFLRDRGFDATRGASSMYAVEAPSQRPEAQPVNAQRIFARLVYLPVHSRTQRHELERLAQALNRFDKTAAATAPAPTKGEPGSLPLVEPSFLDEIKETGFVERVR